MRCLHCYFQYASFFYHEVLDSTSKILSKAPYLNREVSGVATQELSFCLGLDVHIQ